MKRTLVRTILEAPVVGETVTVGGWVRTRRDSKGGFSFIEVNDGSAFGNLQVVADQYGRWLAVLIGLGLLYSRVVRARGRVWGSGVLWGWILVGWGVFNLVEGIIDHHLLAIHHVRPGPQQLWWDLGFLASGAALVAGGWLLQRRSALASPGDAR